MKIGNFGREIVYLKENGVLFHPFRVLETPLRRVPPKTKFLFIASPLLVEFVVEKVYKFII